MCVLHFLIKAFSSFGANLAVHTGGRADRVTFPLSLRQRLSELHVSYRVSLWSGTRHQVLASSQARGWDHWAAQGHLLQGHTGDFPHEATFYKGTEQPIFQISYRFMNTNSCKLTVCSYARTLRKLTFQLPECNSTWHNSSFLLLWMCTILRLLEMPVSS